MIAAPDALGGTGWRRRVAAIGSGFGGLTATKTLKHAQLNITDAVVFLVRIIAQGTSYVVNQTPLWLQVIPAIAGLAATIGALITLLVQRTPRRCAGRIPSVPRAPRRHHTNSRPHRYVPRWGSPPLRRDSRARQRSSRQTS
jgi:hypothetical protein